MPPMLGWLSDARTLASPLEAGQPVGVGCECLRKDLQRDVAFERGIASTIHLTHTTFTELVRDGVRTEGRTGLKRHQAVIRSATSIL